MATSPVVDNSPAGIFACQDTLIQTKDYEPLGVIKVISIAPNAQCPIDNNDPLMRKWGRLMQFRDQALPLAWNKNHTQLLVPGLLIRQDGRVGLPDLKDPEWVAPPATKAEIEGEEYIDAAGMKRSRPVPRDPSKDVAPMYPQGLSKRAEGMWENTEFFCFSPVLSVGFQPEKDARMVGTFAGIDCRYNQADNRHPTLLINGRTGQVRFFGGLYRLVAAVGENLFL